MASLQPASALQRVEELKSLGQSEAAFNLLHETVTDRRFRYITVEQRIQLAVLKKYVGLAVDLDCVRIAREGVMQFRNHCQHSILSVAPMVVIIDYMIEKAGEKLDIVKAQAEAQGLNPSTDLVVEDTNDLAETLASECLQLESDELHALRTNFRQAVKQCTEVHRTCADIIKTTPQLQPHYHRILQFGFEFCLKYRLRNAFRRLSEMALGHYATIMKQKPRTNANATVKEEIEALKKPELHIETRLCQLRCGAALELWKEAAQSLEDLHAMGILELTAKKVLSKPTTPAAIQSKHLLLTSIGAYYEKLALVFLQAGLRTHYALAFLKWLMHCKAHNKTLNAEAKQLFVSLAAVAVLAVPVDAPGSTLTIKEEERRLITLLGYATVPTRGALIDFLNDKGILDACAPCVRDLFALVEEDDGFLPFETKTRALPLIQEIRAMILNNSHIQTIWPDNGLKIMGTLINHVKEGVFRKAILKLSEVYESITIQSFIERVCPPELYSWSDAEFALIRMQKRCGLDLRIQYAESIIRLNSRCDPHRDGRKRLNDLSTRLYSLLLRENASSIEASTQKKLASMRARANAEELARSSRLQLLERKRTELESHRKRMDQNHEEIAREKTLRQLEQEQERMKQLAEDREQARKREEAEAARIRCARQLIEKMKELCKSIGANPDAFDLGGLSLSQHTPATMLARNVSMKNFESALQNYLTKAAQTSQKKQRADYKRTDHLARAYRLAVVKQLPRLKEEMQKQIVEAEEEIEKMRGLFAQRLELLSVVQPKIREWWEEYECEAKSPKA